ncbi:MAG: translation initiation factor IF-2 N-terminal domain-containing protein, partial [Planctomycetia bacterium]|nr:translation initiation factor IF-2 N-terminal domain-containing protein [Planctomycetia bacterium]
MPVRIYSLAKELKLDSKILVDICTSAGVTGKGSALASLTDEEVERVKAYLSGAGQSGKASGAKLRAPTSAMTPELSSDGGTAVRREDYIAPAGTAVEKVPVLADKGLKRKKTNGETAKPAPRPAGATIKLAPLPTAAQPAPAAESQEAAPQKPDLRLPIDAIKAASRSGGTKPLIDHVRKTQGKRKETPGEPGAG